MKEPLKINFHGNEAGLWYCPGYGCPKERIYLEEASIMLRSLRIIQKNCSMEFLSCGEMNLKAALLCFQKSEERQVEEQARSYQGSRFQSLKESISQFHSPTALMDQ